MNRLGVSIDHKREREDREIVSRVFASPEDFTLGDVPMIRRKIFWNFVAALELAPVIVFLIALLLTIFHPGPIRWF
jgi:hypothetical protein